MRQIVKLGSAFSSGEFTPSTGTPGRRQHKMTGANHFSKYGAYLPPPRRNARERYCIVFGGGSGASCARYMTNETGSVPDPKNQRRYIWPWFVFAAVLLAIALAVAWMSKEVERARRIHDLNSPAAPAASGATSSVLLSALAVGRV